jgi:hypothetical protein
MVNADRVQLLREILVVSALVPAWGFVLQLHFGGHGLWRGTVIGRHTMSFAFMIAVILTSSTVAVWFPSYPWRAVVSMLLFAFLTVGLWRAWWLIFQVQRNPRRYARRDEERSRELHG